MAKDKKSFVLYCDFITTFDELTDEEAGRLIKHILQYVNDLNPIMEDRLLKVAFEPIKQQLKRDLRNWEGKLNQKSDGGKLGNLKRWNKDLYDKVISNEITIEEADNIIIDRKRNHSVSDSDKKRRTVSDSDNNNRTVSDGIASVAVNVNDNVNVTVNDNDINISFDVFWDLYDKKVGEKGKLKKKWQSLSDNERELAIKHIPDYKIAQPDKIYRKDPSTYLNNKSFNDEIITSNKNVVTNKVITKPVVYEEGVKEYWQERYGHLASTREEFFKLLQEGKIDDDY